MPAGKAHYEIEEEPLDPDEPPPEPRELA